MKIPFVLIIFVLIFMCQTYLATSRMYLNFIVIEKLTLDGIENEIPGWT